MAKMGFVNFKDCSIYSRWTDLELKEINNFLFVNRNNWKNKNIENAFLLKFNRPLINERLDVRGFYFNVGVSFQFLKNIDFSYCNTTKAFNSCQEKTNKLYDFKYGLGFVDCIIDNCSFHYSELTGFVRSKISSCEFDHAVIDGGGLGSEKIYHCSFRHAKFKKILLSRITFLNCDFSNAQFDGRCDVEYCKFINCNFTETKFGTTLLKQYAGVDNFLKCEFVHSPLSSEQKNKLSETIVITD